MEPLELPVELKLKIIGFLQRDTNPDAHKALMSLCCVWKDTSSTIQKHLWKKFTIPITCDPAKSIMKFQDAVRSTHARELAALVEEVSLNDTAQEPSLSTALASSHALFIYNFGKLRCLKLRGIRLDVIPPKKTFYHALKRISLICLDIIDCSFTHSQFYALLYHTARDLQILRCSGNQVIHARPKVGWENEWGIELAILRTLKLHHLVLDFRTESDAEICDIMARGVDPPFSFASCLSVEGLATASTGVLEDLIRARNVNILDFSRLRPTVRGPLPVITPRELALTIRLRDWTVDSRELTLYIDLLSHIDEKASALQTICIDICIYLRDEDAVTLRRRRASDDFAAFHKLDMLVVSRVPFSPPGLKVKFHIYNDSLFCDVTIKRSVRAYTDWVLSTWLPQIGDILAARNELEGREIDVDFDVHWFGWLDTMV